jgi:ATP adenylyltransferase
VTSPAAHGTVREEQEREVLWAPWRMEYIEGKKPDECIFCTSPSDDVALRASLILDVSRHAQVMLNRYPYTNGHLLISPRQHIAQLVDLPKEAFADLMALLQKSVAIINTALHPQGMNIGINLGACGGAGITDHLHWHVVPRWVGDTNFMPVVGSVHIMPQHLLESYDRLRPYFASSAESKKGSSSQK